MSEFKTGQKVRHVITGAEYQIRKILKNHYKMMDKDGWKFNSVKSYAEKCYEVIGNIHDNPELIAEEEMTELIQKITDILQSATQTIVNNDIYEHGYPEGRLIPITFWEDCQIAHKDSVIEAVSEIIGDYLADLY